jgi:erythronate-4-phosphate dehydrogenase
MKIVADENIPFVKECFASIGEVRTIAGRQITPEALAGADCLLVRSITQVNEKLLANSKVKFVATATIGFEHVDIDYLNKLGIGFASAPGSNSNSVADYLVAALLSVAQKHKITLEGKSIGVVGVGNVGSKVAKKCAALGMAVKLNDPPLFRQTNDPKYRPLNELFKCDFITLHTPLTREGEDKTYHLADEKFFASLKPDCVFINTCRGAVHDTAALKAAITNNKLSAVILDVWEKEPNIDCELLRMVDISTPHIAGYSYDGKITGMIMIYEAACKHFGLKPEHKIEDFLPAPTVPQIVIGSTGFQPVQARPGWPCYIDKISTDSQTLLHEIVQQVYPINRDDFNTREIAMVEQERRGKFFDDLRKNYPVRREFQNTTVVFATEILATEVTEATERKLKGIGFKVKRQK